VALSRPFFRRRRVIVASYCGVRSDPRSSSRDLDVNVSRELEELDSLEAIIDDASWRTTNARAWRSAPSSSSLVLNNAEFAALFKFTSETGRHAYVLNVS